MELLEEPQDQEQQESTSDEIWDDLLGSIAYEEPPEEEASSGLIAKLRDRFTKKEKLVEDEDGEPEAPVKPSRKKLTRRQAIILFILAIVVIAAYFMLVIIIRRTMPATTPHISPVADVAITTTLEIAAETPITATATTVPQANESTPDPTNTPSPTSKVATQYDNNIAADPNNVDLRLQRGNEYLKLRAFDAALADFEHAMQFEEKRAEIYIGIGHANTQLMRWGKAENAFLTAVALNEGLPEPRFGLGLLYYLQGRYEAAARSFDIAAETDPSYAEAEAWLAIASAQLKDIPEAQGAAARAISLTQESAIVFIARAWSALALEPPDIDAAQGDLLYAQDIDQYNFEVLTTMARFYTDYRPERLAEAEQLAIAAADQWASSDLERARGLHVLGRVYLVQERKNDAVDVLTKAADIATLDGDIVLDGLGEDLERALAP